MSELAEVITSEFSEALEVKNPESLKRGIFLLLSSTVQKTQHDAEHNGLKESIHTLNSGVELIALRMEEGFKRMDERFEAVDERFEAVDKRFEAVDKRFEAIQQQMDQRFTAVDQRFEAIDKRFEAMQIQLDRRFNAVDKHFESIDRRFNRLTVLMSIGFVVITTLITIYRFLG